MVVLHWISLLPEETLFGFRKSVQYVDSVGFQWSRSNDIFENHILLVRVATEGVTLVISYKWNQSTEDKLSWSHFMIWFINCYHVSLYGWWTQYNIFITIDQLIWYDEI